MKRRDAYIDLASFAATVAIAAWQKWDSGDLIWGLWISSLILGYAFIVTAALSTYMTGRIPDENAGTREVRKYQPLAMSFFAVIVSIIFIGITNPITLIILAFCIIFGAAALLLGGGVEADGEGKARKALRRLFTYTPAALFMLGFFTVHFGGFHFVHGLFLNSFFPVSDIEPMKSGPADIGLFMLWVVGVTARRYWPLVLFSFLSRIGDFRKDLEKEGGPTMFRPYLNVIRMHILIFVFAGLNALDLGSFVIYLVLLFYFFPVRSIVEVLSGRYRQKKR